MILAAQNKHWGTLEEATRFWAELGIDHIMIKRSQDVQLVSKKGDVLEEEFAKLKKLKEEYGTEFHVHPYGIYVNNTRLSLVDNDIATVFKRVIKGIDEMMQKYGLYPLITLHCTAFDGRNKDGFGEEAALAKSQEFFNGLKIGCQIALENMHHPYVGSKNALIGYKSEHLRKIIDVSDVGVCLDTGHFNLAEEQISSFLEFPVYSMHIEGNNGEVDQHLLPTKETVSRLEDVVAAAKSCRGPIVIEVANHGYTRKEIVKCIDFWKGSIGGR